MNLMILDGYIQKFHQAGKQQQQKQLLDLINLCDTSAPFSMYHSSFEIYKIFAYFVVVFPLSNGI